MSLAYDAIMAQQELDKHFTRVMDEDRAYKLGLLASGGDEEVAYNYVKAIGISKANKYGSPDSKKG